jgi:hypothetical protein
LVGGAGSIVLVMIAPRPVQAEKSGAWTYKGVQDCTYINAETDRSQSNKDMGFGKAQVQAWMSSAAGACQQRNQQPPGYLAVRADLMKWDPSHSVWQLCRTSGQVVNTTTSNQLETSVSGQAASMPCGIGWYGTTAGGWQYSTATHTWRGGTVWSGPHWFGATQPSAKPSAP